MGTVSLTCLQPMLFPKSFVNLLHRQQELVQVIVQFIFKFVHRFS